MSKKATAGTKKGKGKAAKAEVADKVEVASEGKASEVIPPVAIALLEAHPSLPEADRILSLFADHYRGTAMRHAALESAAAAALEEPAKGKKKPRSAMLPPTLPKARPAVSAQPEAVPDFAFSNAEELAAAEAHEPEVSAHVEPEPVGAPEPEAPVAPEPEPEFDLFAELARQEPEAADPDDFLARLQAQGEAAVDGRPSLFEDEEDFTRRLPSDQSNPFIAPPDAAPSGIGDFDEPDGATTMIAAMPDEDDGSTKMIAAVPDDDDGQQLAEPSDSTTMISAVSDEDLENMSAPAADDAAKGGRKSRKASRKKKG